MKIRGVDLWKILAVPGSGGLGMAVFQRSPRSKPMVRVRRQNSWKRGSCEFCPRNWPILPMLKVTLNVILRCIFMNIELWSKVHVKFPKLFSQMSEPSASSCASSSSQTLKLSWNLGLYVLFSLYSLATCCSLPFSTFKIAIGCHRRWTTSLGAYTFAVNYTVTSQLVCYFRLHYKLSLLENWLLRW